MISRWVRPMSKSTNLVLIIDDEPKIRRFLRAGFELHGGFTVLEAEDAAEGLRAATFNAPDLIILDLALPDRRGTEVLELIRSWSNVPIIILSVEANEEEKVRLLEAGSRRLRRQAIRHGRIDRAQPCGAATVFQESQREPRRGRRPTVDRSRRPNRAAQQQPDQIDPQAVPSSTRARDPCWPGGHARPVARGDLERQRAKEHPVSAHSGS